MNNPAAAVRIQDLGEILEQIFLYLDFPNLLRAQQVRKSWRECITGVRSIRNVMWKTPLTLEEEDPHFTKIFPEDNPLYAQQREILEDYHTVLKAFISSPLNPQDWMTYYKDQNKVFRKAIPMQSGVLQDIHCRICWSCHSAFNYANLHPLLQCLQELPLCILGHGSRLLLHLDWSERRCTVHLAKRLADVYRVAQANRLLDDMFTSPISTYLIMSVNDYARHSKFVEENDKGLTLGQAVRFTAKAIHEIVVVRKRDQYPLVGTILGDVDDENTREFYESNAENLAFLEGFGFDSL